MGKEKENDGNGEPKEKVCDILRPTGNILSQLVEKDRWMIRGNTCKIYSEQFGERI